MNSILGEAVARERFSESRFPCWSPTFMPIHRCPFRASELREGERHRLLGMHWETLPVLRAAEGSPLETEVPLQAMERAGSIAALATLSCGAVEGVLL